MVCDFLEHLADQPRSYKISAADKKFALVTKLVETVIEPAAKLDKVDLYEGSAHIALAHQLFYCVPAFGGVRFFEELLSSFQQMIRKRTASSYDHFFALVHGATSPLELDDMMVLLRAGHLKLGHRLMDQPPECLDLGLTCAFCLMGFWSAECTGDLHLVHDRSSNFAKQESIWQAVVNPSLEPREFDCGGTVCRFPIAVGDTRFEDSKNSTALQLADVLAGSVAYYLKTKTRPTEYTKRLHRVFDAGFRLHHSMLPLALDDLSDLPKRSQGSELIDYLTAALRTP